MNLTKILFLILLLPFLCNCASSPHGANSLPLTKSTKKPSTLGQPSQQKNCLYGSIAGLVIAKVTGSDSRAGMALGAGLGCAAGVAIYKIRKRPSHYNSTKNAISSERKINKENIKILKKAAVTLSNMNMNDARRFKNDARRFKNEIDIDISKARLNYRKYSPKSTKTEQVRWSKDIENLERAKNNVMRHMTVLSFLK